jgi:2-iminobutanoate/2-iminopropanoate deaminase
MKPQVMRSDAMPAAIGPYSHAVRLGDVLYISGQPGIDPATGTPREGGFEGEGRQAFENLKTVLEAAGSGMDHVAKLTVMLADASYFPALNALFGEYFPTNPPARSTPIVSLPRGLLISIDAIAGVGE